MLRKVSAKVVIVSNITDLYSTSLSKTH